MSEEAKETKGKSEPKAQEPSAFGVPFSQIPPAPWTLEALGRECYIALARFGGFGEPQNDNYPDLNPRTFAEGIAYKRIVPLLPMPNITNPSKRAQALVNVLSKREAPERYSDDANACAAIVGILAEYEKMDAYLQSFFGVSVGTPDNPAIPKPKPMNQKAR